MSTAMMVRMKGIGEARRRQLSGVMNNDALYGGVRPRTSSYRRSRDEPANMALDGNDTACMAVTGYEHLYGAAGDDHLYGNGCSDGGAERLCWRVTGVL